MNKLILALVIGLSLTCKGNLDKSSEFSIVGKWEWDSYSSSGNFVFYNNGFVEIESDNEKIGGKEFIRDGKKFSLKYRVDYENTPNTLDLIFKELKSENQLIIPGIIDIVENDIVLFARGSDGLRPTSIADSDDKITLYRMQ